MYGDIVQPDTRVLIITMEVCRLDYMFEEIDSLKGQHMLKKFARIFPGEEIPVLVDGEIAIYGGGSLVMIKHLCNRFPEVGEKFRYLENWRKMEMLYSWIIRIFRPVTQEVQKRKLMEIMGVVEKTESYKKET